MTEEQKIRQRLADLERMLKLLETFFKRPPNQTVH
jgi:hypothetical protein